MLRVTTLGFAVAGLLLASSGSLAANRSASAQTRELLNKPLPSTVTIDFRKGVPLRDALDFLRDVSGANFHINWKAIEAAGMDANTEHLSKKIGVSRRRVQQLRRLLR